MKTHETSSDLVIKDEKGEIQIRAVRQTLNTVVVRVKNPITGQFESFCLTTDEIEKLNNHFN